MGRDPHFQIDTLDNSLLVALAIARNGEHFPRESIAQRQGDAPQIEACDDFIVGRAKDSDFLRAEFGFHQQSTDCQWNRIWL